MKSSRIIFYGVSTLVIGCGLWVIYDDAMSHRPRTTLPKELVQVGNCYVPLLPHWKTTPVKDTIEIRSEERSDYFAVITPGDVPMSKYRLGLSFRRFGSTDLWYEDKEQCPTRLLGTHKTRSNIVSFQGYACPQGNQDYQLYVELMWMIINIQDRPNSLS